ncbi:hypothetical protein WN51_07465 [Melipona quadrifasciata]|uniref:Uncharacterized protein n=1 Tax=Melipona quadrifasciata TaxID=166423 RepID=A0A0N0BJ28_9HYME|nr:hypothetical protein WN51_07465 [Melipona quadrifasciata]
MELITKKIDILNVEYSKISPLTFNRFNTIKLKHDEKKRVDGMLNGLLSDDVQYKFKERSFSVVKIYNKIIERVMQPKERHDHGTKAREHESMHFPDNSTRPLRVKRFEPTCEILIRVYLEMLHPWDGVTTRQALRDDGLGVETTLKRQPSVGQTSKLLSTTSIMSRGRIKFFLLKVLLINSRKCNLYPIEYVKLNEPATTGPLDNAHDRSHLFKVSLISHRENPSEKPKASVEKGGESVLALEGVKAKGDGKGFWRTWKREWKSQNLSRTNAWGTITSRRREKFCSEVTCLNEIYFSSPCIDNITILEFNDQQIRICVAIIVKRRTYRPENPVEGGKGGEEQAAMEQKHIMEQVSKGNNLPNSGAKSRPQQAEDHILAKMARNPFDLEEGESRAKKIQETIHSAHRGCLARASISVDVFVLLAVPPRKKDLPAPGEDGERDAMRQQEEERTVEKQRKIEEYLRSKRSILIASIVNIRPVSTWTSSTFDSFPSIRLLPEFLHRFYINRKLQSTLVSFAYLSIIDFQDTRRNISQRNRQRTDEKNRNVPPRWIFADFYAFQAVKMDT